MLVWFHINPTEKIYNSLGLCAFAYKYDKNALQHSCIFYEPKLSFCDWNASFWCSGANLFSPSSPTSSRCCLSLQFYCKLVSAESSSKIPTVLWDTLYYLCSSQYMTVSCFHEYTGLTQIDRGCALHRILWQWVDTHM